MTALALSLAAIVITADPVVASAPVELKKFNVLIGEWKGTGTPSGQPGERRSDFWTESHRWKWKFDKTDVTLICAVDNGKYIESAELRYNSAVQKYEMTITTPGNEARNYSGDMTELGRKSPVLTLDRHNVAPSEVTDRIVLTLLHTNRYLYRVETLEGQGKKFQIVAQVGATKQGVAFASSEPASQCVVSGGPGTIRVSYQAKDYFVCCSGCKAAFLADPDTYIADAAKPND